MTVLLGVIDKTKKKFIDLCCIHCKILLIFHRISSIASQMPRSSNMAEGWHKGFKSLVRCSNPTIWTFLDALKLEQGLTDHKIAE